MYLKQEALLCLLAILAFLLSASQNDQLECGEQVSNPHFMKLRGLKEKKRSLTESKPVFTAVCPVTQSQKMFISPSPHTPISRMMGRFKFEQTAKLEEHSYLWTSPKIFAFWQCAYKQIITKLLLAIKRICIIHTVQITARKRHLFYYLLPAIKLQN